MSFKAKLVINKEHELDVLKYNISLKKGSDTTGKPSTKSTLNPFSIVVESGSKVDFLHWMISPNLTKQVELHIYPRTLDGKIRIIYFSDVHLIGLETTFSGIGEIPMIDNLQFTAAGLNTNNSTVDYSAYWRETRLNEESETTTIDENDNLESEINLE